MQSYLKDTLLSFSAALASAARLFTARQLTTHSHFHDLSQPRLRARKFLWERKDLFETTKGAGDEPWLWRLTPKAKRQYGFDYRTISGDTQRRQHWLGLGDLWLALTYAGAGRKSGIQKRIDSLMCS